MSLSPNMERLELERQTADEALIPAPRDVLHTSTPPTAEQRQAWLHQMWPDLDRFLATCQALQQLQRDLETCPCCGKRGLYRARGKYWVFRCDDCGHRDHNLTILDDENEKERDRDTALPAERERVHPLGLFKR